MSRIRVVIADDEPLVRRALARHLAAEPDVRVVAEARDGDELVDVVAEHRPDLLFLDIRMPGRDGFEALEAMPAGDRPVVVFVTAYSEHALRAFDVHAADYLLKPFDDQRLARALDRARDRLRNRPGDAADADLRDLLRTLAAGAAGAAGAGSAPGTPPDARIPVRKGGRLVYVDVADIDAAEAAGNYVTLLAGDARHSVRETLAAMEDRLATHGFVRIHRSALVRPAAVRELRPLPSGDADLVLRSGVEIRLSRTYREAFEAVMGG